MNEKLTELLFSSAAARALKSAGATDLFLDGIKAVPAEGEFIYLVHLWAVSGVKVSKDDPLSYGRSGLIDSAIHAFALQKYAHEKLLDDQSDQALVITELIWKEIERLEVDAIQADVCDKKEQKKKGGRRRHKNEGRIKTEIVNFLEKNPHAKQIHIVRWVMKALENSGMGSCVSENTIRNYYKEITNNN
ncbi:hypothetical protein JBO44_04895 [Enterobacter asburiae]|uniref:hypothetical protein n=1 Tax=Enterobacter asburiae TaxID=61645 RepID=UPI00192C40A1|nr:hypothetical protein [Enterobacter asburiae]MBL5942680.1 hypothetical protein [Enterobacter asburiae]MBL5951317.1 hypothetical protein [Enterobacter asburiae]